MPMKLNCLYLHMITFNNKSCSAFVWFLSLSWLLSWFLSWLLSWLLSWFLPGLLSGFLSWFLSWFLCWLLSWLLCWLLTRLLPWFLSWLSLGGLLSWLLAWLLSWFLPWFLARFLSRSTWTRCSSRIATFRDSAWAPVSIGPALGVLLVTGGAGVGDDSADPLAAAVPVGC